MLTLAALQDIDSPERGVLLVGRDHKVIYANRRAAEIFAASLGELMGTALPENVVRRPADQHEVVEEVLESRLKDGAVFHRYSTPVYSSNGEPAGRIEIYSDITARRELEKEILDQNTELANLNRRLGEAQEQLIQSERLRALGEMAAGIAHDINNVLGIVLGNAQLARRKLRSDHEAQRCIEAIELAARDAAETVRRLREIGKPLDSTDHETVDLSEIVDDVVRSAVPAWRESRSHGGAEIEVVTRLQPNCLVMGSAPELREALANLLFNAAQAVEERGRIELATSRDAKHVELTVRDNGVGMSDQTRERLFDAFFTTRGAEGTGLGMSMVQAIAIRHRGRITVESEEGKGTAVTLRLPAIEGRGEETP